MVLLNNGNLLNIQEYHMLKCLEKKKDKKYIVPLTKTLKDNNIDTDIIDIGTFGSKYSNQNKYITYNKK